MHHAFIFDPDDPPTPACHAPTIVALPDRLVAAWFAGSHEKNPDVGIWCAINRNGDWETPRQVADGWGEACWNPVLCDTTAGLHLFYKVGTSPGRWRGAVLTSPDGGETWRDRGALSRGARGARPSHERLPPPFLGPVKNKPLVLANGDLLCPSSREMDGWRCHFETFSADLLPLGESVVPDPDDLRAIQPAVYRRGTGFEALVRTKSGCIGRTASPDGHRWSPLEATALPNPNSGIDVANLPDGSALLAYNPTTTPDGRWGGARTPITLAHSGSDGTWRDVMTLDDDASAPDGSAPEFSYPAVICGDAVHVVYTWHRRTIKHVRVAIGDLQAAMVNDALDESPAPASEWPTLFKVLGPELLGCLVGVSVSSARRYLSQVRQTPDAVAERLHFIALVVGDLAGAYNEIGVRRWFERPRKRLGGSAPSAVLVGDWHSEDEGPRRVRELAKSLAYPAAT